MSSEVLDLKVDYDHRLRSDVTTKAIASGLVSARPPLSTAFLGQTAAFRTIVASITAVSPIGRSFVTFVVVNPSSELLQVLSVVVSNYSSSDNFSSSATDPTTASPRQV